MLSEQIRLDRGSRSGLVRQLFEQIRALIEAGILVSGTSLPASRHLAKDLGVGRNTVMAAYEQLVMEGYLRSDGRRGTRVSAASRGFEARSLKAATEQEFGLIPRLSEEARRVGSVGRRTYPASTTLQPGLPEVRHFPHDLWGRLLRRAARQVHGCPDQSSYAHYTGLPQLQEAILSHISASRGVVAQPDQVIILSSAQAAMDLVCRLLLNEGDYALHEEPGYAGMWAALQAVGARSYPIEVHRADAYGNLLRLLPETAVPRLVYLTPSHQFPTGHVLSLEDRLAVLVLAREHGFFILEDDYDSEFHFSGSPISCLQGLDRHGQVIYMGTFSKSLMPSLHVAYLVVPPLLVEPMGRMVRNIGAVPALVVQRALSDFIMEGHFRAYIRQMAKLYEKQRDALLHCLQLRCGDWLDPMLPDGGIQLPSYFKEPHPETSDDEIAKRLVIAGIECSALSSLYWSGRVAPRQGLLFGFAASDPDEISDGVQHIERVLRAINA